MEHNYIAREKDQNSITEYKKGIETETLDALVECYNGQVMCGILEVHQQALYLIVLRQELKESPAYLLKHIMGLVGPIEVVDGNIGIKGIKPQGKPVCILWLKQIYEKKFVLTIGYL
tara:strand:- start:53 stop:403 length:351 start_codon:yes stop_codon:yes gene_type:complete